METTQKKVRSDSVTFKHFYARLKNFTGAVTSADELTFFKQRVAYADLKDLKLLPQTIPHNGKELPFFSSLGTEVDSTPVGTSLSFHDWLKKESSTAFFDQSSFSK